MLRIAGFALSFFALATLSSGCLGKDTKGTPRDAVVGMQKAIIDNDREAFLKSFNANEETKHLESLFDFLRATYELDTTLRKTYKKADLKTFFLDEFRSGFLWSEEWLKNTKFIEDKGQAVLINKEEGIELFLVKDEDVWLIEPPLPGVTRWTSDLSLDKKRRIAVMKREELKSIKKPIYEADSISDSRSRETEAFKKAALSLRDIEKKIAKSDWNSEKAAMEIAMIFMELMGGKI